MASNHEVQVDGVVQPCQHSPHEVLHHGVVFILATTVVSMQTDGTLAKAVMAEKEVQHADNCVRPLACVTGLVNDEVHLPWDCFTADPKDGRLPWC